MEIYQLNMLIDASFCLGKKNYMYMYNMHKKSASDAAYMQVQLYKCTCTVYVLYKK